MADIAKRLEKAEKYLQKGKTESALEEYLEILQEDPNNEAVRNSAADLCITLNRGKDAAKLLSELFDHQAAIGDASKAAISYKKIARLGTPTVDQTYRYAQLVEKSNKEAALEAYETAYNAMRAGSREGEALAALGRLVALDPSTKNYKRQGDLAAQMGDGKTASLAFLHLGDGDKPNSDARFGYYERAYTLDPSNRAAALAYGRALLGRKASSSAITVLGPIAATPGSPPEFREAYAEALMAAQRPADAEPLVWELFEKDPNKLGDVSSLIATLIEVENSHHALELAQKLEQQMLKAGKRREFVAVMKEITDQHPPEIEFMEYLVSLYNSSNREGDYCQTLLKLFQLYYAAGNFLKAADALDRAAEVDPYESGHSKRLELLRGKVDANRFNAIANRFVVTGVETQESADGAKPAAGGETTVLEDFLLQAEIFLQYGMRSKAVDRLERISKLFPREEEKNEKLRQLYMTAGLAPKYEGAAAPSPPAPIFGTQSIPVAVAATPAGAPVPTGAGPPTQMVAAAPSAADETAVDNISRVTEITRNIYRQANVKGVLFTAVNDIGRHWSASRCIAGLCAPGKPPSAALEYCATGVKPSDVMAIVKLIGGIQALAVKDGTVVLPRAQGAPELASIQQHITALGIQSIMGVPLIDGDEQAGILILEQCDAPRQWRSTDVVVLKTIADQIVLAVNNARLRTLMKTLAVTDEKSGLLKRSSYLDVLLSEVRRGLQQNSSVAVMLLHFGKASTLVKEIGEAAVDSLMQQLGQTVCANIRQNDVAVRYELTTIALILGDTNDKNAFFVVDKMRKVLAGNKLPGTDRPVPITVGIAEAVMQPRFDPLDIVTEVINRAEAALEAAKAEGGNKAQSLAPALQETAVA